MTIRVGKHISADLPRRISKLEVAIEVPLAPDHPERKTLESAAQTCPVFQSIHPDIQVPVEWTWRKK